MRYIVKNTPCGQVRGAQCDTHCLYSNIRYATARRWERPEEVTAWEGECDATQPALWSMQEAAFREVRTPTRLFYNYETVPKLYLRYSEDGLRLNIWTPREAENLPVLVYIHGGGYNAGGCGGLHFSGEGYAQKGILCVTINYRLTAFASAVGGNHTGNYGLWDQICALQWLKRNIAAYGGDPEKITIMGQSAGAMSVQNLIYSPLAKGLFQGAIMVSGGGIFPTAFAIRTPETAQKLWNEVREELGMDWDQMQTMDAEELFLAWERVNLRGKYITSTTPVVDGITIPELPAKLVEEGKINYVPTIIGFLSEDMWPNTLYNLARDWGVAMEKAGKVPAYGYYFDRQIPGSDHGAFHSGDLRYIFNTFHTGWRPYEDIDYRISEEIMDYFVQFVRTGDPNGQGKAPWTPIAQENTRFMHFGDAPCQMAEVPQQRLVDTQAKGKPFPS